MLQIVEHDPRRTQYSNFLDALTPGIAMKLYDNPFSPFARKVRMVLEHKGLEFELIDGLDKAGHDALAAINGRIEVPALADGELTVVNSADIVAYLDHKYPQNPVIPEDPTTRAAARAWERCADTVVDPILVDISYWSWADRPDDMPKGMKSAAQTDLNEVYDALESELAIGDFVCGEFSIADIALFPHLTAVRLLDVSFDGKRYARLLAWLTRMRGIQICADDLDRSRKYFETVDISNIERTKIFWRGDRIEWILARGYHDWFMGEIEAGRVMWPGLGIPRPRPQ